jgi:hypothetical protein
MASQAASLDDVAEAVALLHQVCEDHGREATDFGVRATVPPGLRADGKWETTLERSVTYAEQLGSIGVTNVCLPIAQFVSRRDEATSFVQAFRSSLTR